MSRKNKRPYRKLTLAEMYHYYGRDRMRCPICGKVGTLRGSLIIHSASWRKVRGVDSIRIFEWCENSHKENNSWH